MFFNENLFWKDSTNFRPWKMTLKLRILRSLTRLFIILVSLTRSLFSEKILISNRRISGLMSSWITKNLGRSLVWILEIDDFPIFQILKEFGEDLEDPRIDKIYSSGNRGVKKVQDLGDRAMWKSFCHPYTHVNNVHIALGWLYAIFLDVILNKCNINRF